MKIRVDPIIWSNIITRTYHSIVMTSSCLIHVCNCGKIFKSEALSLFIDKTNIQSQLTSKRVGIKRGLRTRPQLISTTPSVSGLLSFTTCRMKHRHSIPRKTVITKYGLQTCRMQYSVGSPDVGCVVSSQFITVSDSVNGLLTSWVQCVLTQFNCDVVNTNLSTLRR